MARMIQPHFFLFVPDIVNSFGDLASTLVVSGEKLARLSLVKQEESRSVESQRVGPGGTL
jgi:hypothetical protein